MEFTSFLFPRSVSCNGPDAERPCGIHLTKRGNEMNRFTVIRAYAQNPIRCANKVRIVNEDAIPNNKTLRTHANPA